MFTFSMNPFFRTKNNFLLYFFSSFILWIFRKNRSQLWIIFFFSFQIIYPHRSGRFLQTFLFKKVKIFFTNFLLFFLLIFCAIFSCIFFLIFEPMAPPSVIFVKFSKKFRIRSWLKNTIFKNYGLTTWMPYNANGSIIRPLRLIYAQLALKWCFFEILTSFSSLENPSRIWLKFIRKKNIFLTPPSFPLKIEFFY